MFNQASFAGGRGGSGPMRILYRLVVLAFALVQLVLVARILLDLGVIPTDLAFADSIPGLSDALAAPVAGLGQGIGGLFGGSGVLGVGAAGGDGLNPTMIAALLGWTVLEGLVLRVVGKLLAV